ncbi:MAG: tRNA (adenosine(37)-N6)-threonylcarbamoyltransferase complex ATPase subunit type 1 TsaE [Flavobacteriaceae bacterium]|nr:tRNA (adenosine(37)-N6)-threonylcarbamoyltransferase complex ATPase subunit type 1 TsaE [Flavobacteriaceae bacterium]
MAKKKFKLEDLTKVAQSILEGDGSKLFAFKGAMGVGKTTLIKALIHELGAIDQGNSPTFGLVNEYHDTQGKIIAYHFDFYRIENEGEAYDMGVDEYFDSGAYVFMEWPERIATILPEDTRTVSLHLIDENTRSIEY